MKPILLGPNQPGLFYRGGIAVASFRGLAPNGGSVPEDGVEVIRCLPHHVEEADR
jgi:hypothetical protein